MSTKDCLDAIGDISAEEIAEFKSADDKLELLAKKKKDAIRRKELLGRQKAIHEEALSKILSHPNGPTVGLRSILTNDLSGNAKNSNIEYRAKAIYGQSQSTMIDVIEHLSTDMLGFHKKNKSDANDMIRELFDVDTGNAKAKEMARQWNETAENMRIRFNKGGGDISKLDTWGLPQSHSQEKIFKAGFDEWSDFIRPKLRNADEIDLSYVYETLSTGGLNKVKEVTPQAGGKMTANKGQEARVLHFKDGDAWLEYNQKFGRTSDPLSVMQDHARGMAIDTANIEILGPNPDNMFKTLLKEVQHANNLTEVEIKKLEKLPKTPKTKAEIKKLKKSMDGYNNYTQGLYNEVSGKLDESAATTVGGKVAQSLIETVRAVQTATKLGGATLAAVTDLGTTFANLGRNDMSKLGFTKQLLKNLNPITGISQQKQAARLGLGLDIFNSSITKRFDEVGKGMSSQAAEAVMRATGMNWWTESMRKAFQFEFYNHLSNLTLKAKRTNTLPGIYKAYGFTLDEVKALDFDNLDLTTSTRLLEMANQEGDYAVMMPNARSRVITTGGQQRGTLSGELTRTAMQFKSFPATFTIQQMGRVFMDANAGTMDKVKYGATLFASTTLLGSLAMEMKDKSKGYTEPRKGSPWRRGDSKIEDTTKYWTAAIIQGGGAGILGDFIFSDQSRYGGGITSAVVGPTAGTIERAYKTTIGNVHDYIGGKDTHAGPEIIDFMNREVNPLNLFYTKALIEMYVVDFLKQATDKKWNKKKRAIAKKRRKEYGQRKARTFQEMMGGD